MMFGCFTTASLIATNTFQHDRPVTVATSAFVRDLYSTTLPSERLCVIHHPVSQYLAVPEHCRFSFTMG
jgi:hypothetical protein